MRTPHAFSFVASSSENGFPSVTPPLPHPRSVADFISHTGGGGYTAGVLPLVDGSENHFAHGDSDFADHGGLIAVTGTVPLAAPERDGFDRPVGRGDRF
ncbi:hypothetical protein Natoc_3255 [Natronococcus occultus SP4]|uniref:Uncharacterized protein n=1 Tax=Natronococcus occultus SP4 TaxID=694430 RepID=L0K4F9_9EURY|nr:hypothetical protein Natoc_3255 [Natronococcus occultus SP4]